MTPSALRAMGLYNHMPGKIHPSAGIRSIRIFFSSLKVQSDVQLNNHCKFTLIILSTELLEAEMQVLMCRSCTLIVILGNEETHE